MKKEKKAGESGNSLNAALVRYFDGKADETIPPILEERHQTS
jgi:hypothetical protein